MEMLLEQELASIMAFALKYADNPFPYYWSVPQSFRCPAMFFPQPEIITGGDTFNTYAMRYSWYINIFGKSTESSHALAWKVLTALKQSRNLVPLIKNDGNAEGRCLRLDDPSLRNVDAGVSQLSLSWTSRRPYNNDEAQKMMVWDINDMRLKGNTPDVADAMKNAVENYPHISP